jgi:hypothetical protein
MVINIKIEASVVQVQRAAFNYPSAPGSNPAKVVRIFQGEKKFSARLPSEGK